MQRMSGGRQSSWVSAHLDNTWLIGCLLHKRHASRCAWQLASWQKSEKITLLSYTMVSTSDWVLRVSMLCAPRLDQCIFAVRSNTASADPVTMAKPSEHYPIIETSKFGDQLRPTAMAGLGVL